jgi:Domain of unknown function (DUF1707)/Cell wall-active antibiotics response 4TMS YvqF
VAGVPEVRASDAERERTVELLRGHATEGRLTMEELGERVERAYEARTRAELEEIVRDLPSEATRPPAPRKATRFLLAMWGGGDRKGRWRIGSKLTAVAFMGGGDLDLRQAEIEADEVTIDVVAVMGGYDLYVPETIEVDLDDVAIMGGNDLRGSPAPAPPGAPRLHIRAFSLMGGIDVWRLPAGSKGRPLREAKKMAKALEP